MRRPLTGLLACGLLALGSQAQMVMPANPGKFKSRAIGGDSSGGVQVTPKENPKVRYTTHVLLSESRQWASVEGKVIEGNLIAFEDIVVEGVQGGPPPAAPDPPACPTVVRNGKARLLVNHKPVEVQLERLVQADRDFIEQTRAALQKKTPPTP